MACLSKHMVPNDRFIPVTVFYLKRMVQWQMTQLFLGLIPKANDDKWPMIAGICHCKWWKHVSSICPSKASSFHYMYKTSPGSFPNFCFWWATFFLKYHLERSTGVIKPNHGPIANCHPFWEWLVISVSIWRSKVAPCIEDITNFAAGNHSFENRLLEKKPTNFAA